MQSIKKLCGEKTADADKDGKTKKRMKKKRKSFLVIKQMDYRVNFSFNNNHVSNFLFV